MPSTLFTSGTVYTSAWGNEVDKATHNYLSAVAGTNTITATGPVSGVSYVAGDRFYFVPAITNTGATTININGLGTKNLTKYGTSTLVAGDLTSAVVAEIVYDGVQFQLINPQSINPNVPVSGRLIGTQVFTASGTYTPTAGTTSVIVELVGGGGGSGGNPATGAGQLAIAGSGGGGGYAKSRLTSGFSGQTVTIGAGGTAGNGATAGGTGGSTTFGVLVGATGGSGGAVGSANANPNSGSFAGGIGTVGNILLLKGGSSAVSYGVFTVIPYVTSGRGGDSALGIGAQAALISTGGNVAGIAGQNYGGGASGAISGASQGGAGGAVGGPGVLIVYEYS